jgi:hypothetical protein
MSVAITDRDKVDIEEIIRRSPVASLPEAAQALRYYIRRSIEVRYGYVGDQVACVWGLRPPSLLSDNAYLWLLTTNLVEEHKFLFIRHSQRWIEEALKRYPTITGDVIPPDNWRARRWIEWLGGVFSTPIDGRAPFVIRAKNG